MTWDSVDKNFVFECTENYIQVIIRLSCKEIEYYENLFLLVKYSYISDCVTNLKTCNFCVEFLRV